MEPRFNINDFVKHISTVELYKVIEITQGEYQFLYKLQTLENVIIENLFPENHLEIND